MLPKLQDPEVLPYLSRLEHLVNMERLSSCRVVQALSDIEQRKLHLRAGYSSLFAFCTIALGYSEPAALRRIKAARVTRRYPQAGRLLRLGKLNLSTIDVLADVLKPENSEKLLAEAAGKTKREVEKIRAALKPEFERVVYDRLQSFYVPVLKTGGRNEDDNAQRPMTWMAVMPEKLKRRLPNHLRCEGREYQFEERIKVSFAAPPALGEKINRVRELMSGKFARGARLENIFAAALDCYIERYCPAERAKRAEKRMAKCKEKQLLRAKGAGGGKRGRLRKARRSRHISAAVKAEVFLRDGCRCTYRGPDGRRCGSAFDLEVDHIVPFAMGGSNQAGNLRLLCREHNQLEADRVFGKRG